MKNLDDILSEKEKELERQFKHNYLVSYSHLIASNINSIYELYGNSGTEYTYEMIKKSFDKIKNLEIITDNEEKKRQLYQRCLDLIK